MTSKAYAKRDLYKSKETYTNQKRPIVYLVSSQKRRIYIQRDVYISQETYIHQKRRKYVKRDQDLLT